MPGKLELVIGPMYSGKTTYLIRMKNRYTIGGKHCIFIKYQHDNRYSDTNVVSHDNIEEKAVKSINNSLMDTIETISDIDNYDVILIDEIQFFNDGAESCDVLANRGFTVIAAGLQGDYKKEPFDSISKLIPKADKIKHLTAVDKYNGLDAPFTVRIGNSKKQVIIGGKKMYMSLSRENYNKFI